MFTSLFPGSLGSLEIAVCYSRVEEYHEGIIIPSVHVAKGLEFDQVIVLFVDEPTYQTDLDKSKKNPLTMMKLNIDRTVLKSCDKIDGNIYYIAGGCQCRKSAKNS